MGGGWSTDDIPKDLSDKNVIVTGANSGIGFFAAMELGAHGANVILACRDKKRGEAALEEMTSTHRNGKYSLELLDLEKMSSVRSFVERVKNGDTALGRNPRIHILLNNAGIMMPPKRLEAEETKCELQFQVNHLGHFYLTGLLLPVLYETAKERFTPAGDPPSDYRLKPRVVNVASVIAGQGSSIQWDDLQATKSYNDQTWYRQSKTFNLLFTDGLSTRCPWLLCLTAHPGISNTNLTRHGAFWCCLTCCGSSPCDGALPLIRACVEDKMDDLTSKDYFGPSGPEGLRGAPVRVALPFAAKQPGYANRLWEESEKLSGWDFAKEFGDDHQHSYGATASA